MSRTVFISYSHRQGDWVWDRLVPCLRAGGAEVLVDRERFGAGKAVYKQMDEVQDRAEIILLVLSPEYLESEPCKREMERAIERDPMFERGIVIPVVVIQCNLPPEILEPDPIRVDLCDEQGAEQWKMLLDTCGVNLGTAAPTWLKARDDVRRHLERGESVNLTVEGSALWRPLIEHLRTDVFSDIGIVDLQQGSTASRHGLIQAILDTCGASIPVPKEPDDLRELDKVLSVRRITRVALTHFDLVAHRSHDYGLDLFAALRYLVMESRTLVLLIQSRSPFAALLPKDHPLSPIDLKTVELKGRS